MSTQDEETRVQCTLLEYGRRYGTSKVLPTGDSTPGKKEKSAEEQEDLIEREERRVAKIMKKMSALDSAAISATVVESMAGLKTDELKQMSSAFAEEAAAIAAEQDSKAGGVAAHKRAITALEKQFDAATSKVDVLQPEFDQLSADHEEAQAAAKKAMTYSKRIAKEMAKLDALEADEANREVLEKLRTLIAQNESLKEQMSKFKSTCESEMNALEAKIAAIQGDGFEAITDERVLAIRNQLEADKAKMEKLKQLSAKRNREISRWERQIDEYPSRAELNQYQRRFLDLWGQMSARLREAKQYYLQYNVHADSTQYYAKESTLLDSIYENFEMAMKTAGGKEQLLKQMEQIVRVITFNCVLRLFCFLVLFCSFGFGWRCVCWVVGVFGCVMVLVLLALAVDLLYCCFLNLLFWYFLFDFDINVSLHLYVFLKKTNKNYLLFRFPSPPSSWSKVICYEQE